jgi:hypothetical protein
MYDDVHRSAHPVALTRDKVRIFGLLAIRASSDPGSSTAATKYDSPIDPFDGFVFP